MLLYTMKNRGQKLASYSHTFYSQSAEGVALLYSASSFNSTIVTFAPSWRKYWKKPWREWSGSQLY